MKNFFLILFLFSATLNSCKKEEIKNETSENSLMNSTSVGTKNLRDAGNTYRVLVHLVNPLTGHVIIYCHSSGGNCLNTVVITAKATEEATQIDNTISELDEAIANNSINNFFNKTEKWSKLFSGISNIHLSMLQNNQVRLIKQEAFVPENADINTQYLAYVAYPINSDCTPDNAIFALTIDYKQE